MVVQLILVFVLDKSLIIARYLQMSVVVVVVMTSQIVMTVIQTGSDSDWLMVKYSDWRRQGLNLYLVNRLNVGLN